MGAALVAVFASNAYAQNNLSLSNKAYADGQHLVNIYSDGNTNTIATSASTVHAALEQMHVKLGQGDVVEPAIATKINQPSFNINVYRGIPAIILDNGKRIHVITGYQSPRQIVTAAGLTLYPEDTVAIGRANNLSVNQSIGREIMITRAKPVQVVLAGQVYNFRTQRATVGELFVEKGLLVKSSDEVNVDLTSTVSPGMRIVVNRLTQTITQVNQPIDAGLSYEYDGNQPVGFSAVKQEGRAGVKLVSYLVGLTNGVETGRSVLDQKVIAQPVTKIVVRGTKVVVPGADLTPQKQELMTQAGIAGADFSYVDYIVSREGGWNGVQKYFGNGSSGAYGLCQALPASKMSLAGADYMTNPVTQLKWCNSYAIGRFGSWSRAYQFWIVNKWW